MSNECKCCGRTAELRLGFCWDCVESESVIQEGTDMYDKEIPIQKELTKGMSKLQYILKKYIQSLKQPKKD